MRLLPASLSVLLLASFEPGPPHIAGFGHGTSVVVLRSQKVLLAAVDSKEVYRLYNGDKATESERQRCKVAPIGPWFAILSGVEEGTNGFDALTDARHSWHEGATLDDIEANARHTIPPHLLPLLTRVAEADPAGFAARYAGQAALQLTLLGVSRGSPQLTLLEFIPERSSSGALLLNTRVTHCPGDCTGAQNAYFLGTHEAIDRAVQRNSGLLRRPDEQNLESLIRIEYEARPDIVGGPLSIVRVAPSGARLIRSGACAP